MKNKRLGIVGALASAALLVTGMVAPAHSAGKSLVIWTDADRAKTVQTLSAAWAAKNGVTLTVVVKTDVRAATVEAAPKGVGPDIILGAHDWVGQLAASGILEPMTGVNKSLFSSSAIAGFTYNSTLYGVPFGTENLALITNKNLVPTGAPATWADLESSALALIKSGKATHGLYSPCGGYSSCDPYHHFFLNTALGGFVFGSRGGNAGSLNTKNIGLASKTFLANAAMLDKWVGEGLIDKGSGSGSDYDFKDWYNNKAPYMITGPWNLGAIQKSGVPYAISAVPAPVAGLKAVPFMGAQGAMISKFTTNKLLARKYLNDVVSSDDFQTGLYKLGGRPPALNSTLEAVSKSDPDIAAFGTAGVGAVPMPNIPQMASVWTDFGTAWAAVLTGKLKAAPAFTMAAKNIAKLVG